jgi:DNA polymerase-4
MGKVVLHADLNNFYASVACLSHPDWRETPLAVCGDPALRHGIVLAKNMPAKRRGVITGQAVWQARQSCPNLRTVAPDLEEVLRYSGLVRRIFARYTNRVQPFGVDEAWLDVSGPRMDIDEGFRIANHLRHAVREETGLTLSVGVGDNRIFAKLGSDLKKPDGVSVVCEQNRRTVLDPLPVGDLLFIGRATAQKLRSIGIFTIGQLAAVDPSVLKAVFGKTGLMLSGFARGNDDAAVLAEDDQASSPCTTRASPCTACAKAWPPACASTALRAGWCSCPCETPRWIGINVSRSCRSLPIAALICLKPPTRCSRPTGGWATRCVPWV